MLNGFLVTGPRAVSEPGALMDGALNFWVSVGAQTHEHPAVPLFFLVGPVRISGVDCYWIPCVCASRQYELIGNADNARMSAHGADLVSLTDPTLLLFGSAALTPMIKEGG
jgi:hypothetical protein